MALLSPKKTSVKVVPIYVETPSNIDIESQRSNEKLIATK
jgi:hypothetical protein